MVSFRVFLSDNINHSYSKCKWTQMWPEKRNDFQLSYPKGNSHSFPPSNTVKSAMKHTGPSSGEEMLFLAMARKSLEGLQF